MSDEERLQSRRFRRESDRLRYIASRLLLRQALSRASHGRVSPGQWQFREGAHGKLHIDAGAGLPLLQFNLSHAGRIVVVAVSASCAVGVDVERMDRPLAVIPADVALTMRERAWLASQPEEAKTERFIQMWTVKEACAKLSGTGTSEEFSSFEVALDPARIVPLKGSAQFKHLALETRELEMGGERYHLCLAAACSSPEPFQLRIHGMDRLVVR
jgi:4'-phosphopantetheinyl transferase